MRVYMEWAGTLWGTEASPGLPACWVSLTDTGAVFEGFSASCASEAFYFRLPLLSCGSCFLTVAQCSWPWSAMAPDYFTLQMKDLPILSWVLVQISESDRGSDELGSFFWPRPDYRQQPVQGQTALTRLAVLVIRTCAVQRGGEAVGSRGWSNRKIRRGGYDYSTYQRRRLNGFCFWKSLTGHHGNPLLEDVQCIKPVRYLKCFIVAKARESLPLCEGKKGNLEDILATVGKD